MTTRGYTLLEAPRPRQTLVHAHPDPAELGRVYEPELPIVTALPELAAALTQLGVVDPSRWEGWAAAARADYVASLERRPLPGDVDLGEVLAFLRGRLPEDAVLACGAGNFTVWVHRYFEFSRYPTQLAPRAGAMGYGLPAALTAKVLDPARPAVCIAGDGDFMMSSAELATAVQYGLDVVVLVVDNGMYGTIRMHQERLYPGRVVGTDLVNPDFAAFARSRSAAMPRRSSDRRGGGRVRARRRIRQAGGHRPARRSGGDPPAAHDLRDSRRRGRIGLRHRRSKGARWRRRTSRR